MKHPSMNIDVKGKFTLFHLCFFNIIYLNDRKVAQTAHKHKLNVCTQFLQ